MSLRIPRVNSTWKYKYDLEVPTHVKVVKATKDGWELRFIKDKRLYGKSYAYTRYELGWFYSSYEPLNNISSHELIQKLKCA